MIVIGRFRSWTQNIDTKTDTFMVFPCLLSGSALKYELAIVCLFLIQHNTDVPSEQSPKYKKFL